MVSGDYGGPASPTSAPSSRPPASTLETVMASVSNKKDAWLKKAEGKTALLSNELSEAACIQIQIGLDPVNAVTLGIGASIQASIATRGLSSALTITAKGHLSLDVGIGFKFSGSIAFELAATFLLPWIAKKVLSMASLIVRQFGKDLMVRWLRKKYGGTTGANEATSRVDLAMTAQMMLSGHAIIEHGVLVEKPGFETYKPLSKFYEYARVYALTKYIRFFFDFHKEMVNAAEAMTPQRKRYHGQTMQSLEEGEKPNFPKHTREYMEEEAKKEKNSPRDTRDAPTVAKLWAKYGPKRDKDGKFIPRGNAELGGKLTLWLEAAVFIKHFMPKLFVAKPDGSQSWSERLAAFPDVDEDYSTDLTLSSIDCGEEKAPTDISHAAFKTEEYLEKMICLAFKHGLFFNTHSDSVVVPPEEIPVQEPDFGVDGDDAFLAAAERQTAAGLSQKPAGPPPPPPGASFAETNQARDTKRQSAAHRAKRQQNLAYKKIDRVLSSRVDPKAPVFIELEEDAQVDISSRVFPKLRGLKGHPKQTLGEALRRMFNQFSHAMNGLDDFSVLAMQSTNQQLAAVGRLPEDILESFANQMAAYMLQLPSAVPEEPRRQPGVPASRDRAGPLAPDLSLPSSLSAPTSISDSAPTSISHIEGIDEVIKAFHISGEMPEGPLLEHLQETLIAKFTITPNILKLSALMMEPGTVNVIIEALVDPQPRFEPVEATFSIAFSFGLTLFQPNSWCTGDGPFLSTTTQFNYEYDSTLSEKTVDAEAEIPEEEPCTPVPVGNSRTAKMWHWVTNTWVAKAAGAAAQVMKTKLPSFNFQRNWKYKGKFTNFMVDFLQNGALQIIYAKGLERGECPTAGWKGRSLQVKVRLAGNLPGGLATSGDVAAQCVEFDSTGSDPAEMFKWLKCRVGQFGVDLPSWGGTGALVDALSSALAIHPSVAHTHASTWGVDIKFDLHGPGGKTESEMPPTASLFSLHLREFVVQTDTVSALSGTLRPAQVPITLTGSYTSTAKMTLEFGYEGDDAVPVAHRAMTTPVPAAVTKKPGFPGGFTLDKLRNFYSHNHPYKMGRLNEVVQTIKKSAEEKGEEWEDLLYRSLMEKYPNAKDADFETAAAPPTLPTAEPATTPAGAEAQNSPGV